MVKGFVQTLEAVIAVTLILFSILFIYSGQVESKDFSEQSFRCLEYLDKKGTLRSVERLEEDLRICLPPTVDFIVKICESPKCSATVPEKTVSLSSYIIAGYTEPDPRLINLWVWEQ